MAVFNVLGARPGQQIQVGANAWRSINDDGTVELSAEESTVAKGCFDLEPIAKSK